MKELIFKSYFGYDEAEIIDSEENVVGTCVITYSNIVRIYYKKQDVIHYCKSFDEAVSFANDCIKYCIESKLFKE